MSRIPALHARANRHAQLAAKWVIRGNNERALTHLCRCIGLREAIEIMGRRRKGVA